MITRDEKLRCPERLVLHFDLRKRNRAAEVSLSYGGYAVYFFVKIHPHLKCGCFCRIFRWGLMNDIFVKGYYSLVNSKGSHHHIKQLFNTLPMAFWTRNIKRK
jgi:hypothetical protein